MCGVALIKLSHEYFFVVGNDSESKRKWFLRERGNWKSSFESDLVTDREKEKGMGTSKCH